MSGCGAGWVFCLALLAACCGLSTARRPLVLLVLDGFRWDYQDLLPLGHEGSLHMLETEGVRTQHVFPVFPSVSYASWTSIATGRWTESHGIVGNHMFDRKLGKFSLFNATLTGKPGWWNAGADPIWTTATEQGVKTAVIGFSRCDVAVHGVKPASCQPFKKFDQLQTLQDHLALAVSKIDEGFQFVIVYADYLDTIGHAYGPSGKKIRQAMLEVDQELKGFFDEFRQRKKLDKVNFVMVSDHGMTEIGERVGTNRVYLDLHLSLLLAEHIIDSGAYTQIIPRPDTRQQILSELEQMPNVTVYTKDEFPAEWHYSNHPRIPDILVLADPGNVIIGAQTDNVLPLLDLGAWDNTRGIHGYTRNFTDMATIFYAMGPDFRSSYKQPPMELVDTYQVLAHVLGIKPQPHNGTWDTVRGMLSLSPAAALRPSIGGAALLPLVALVVARLTTAGLVG